MSDKELIEKMKDIYNQFSGLGNDEDAMWAEIVQETLSHYHPLLREAVENEFHGLGFMDKPVIFKDGALKAIDSIMKQENSDEQ